MNATHGVFVCPTCRDNPGEDCGDACHSEWASDLPAMGQEDFWPLCPCCGRDASLVTALAPVA
jgi:hypothetical protein